MVTYSVLDNGNISVRCPHCNNSYEVPITEAEFLNWDFQTTYVQDAFPQLPPEQREQLVTGICPECWNQIFPEEDEDDF